MPASARAGALIAACSLALIACSGGGGDARDQQPTSTSLRNLDNRDGTLDQRLARMEQAWIASANTPDRPAARQRLKDVAWTNTEPFQIRSRAVQLLADDPDPAGSDDTRDMVKLMLPREQSRGMVAMLCQLCVDRNWQDATPALVRSYSRIVDAVGEQDRSERWAIGQLNPGRSLFDIAFGVFLDPRTDPGPPGANFDQRTRADAWTLMSRLDPSGRERRRVLATASSGSPDVRLMQRCASELAALPNTPAEMEWATSLMSERDEASTAWRREVSAATSRLSDAQRDNLALRHLEPIRWAAMNEPALLNQSRDELISGLTARLAGRPSFQRRVERNEGGDLRPESLAENAPHLSWGDLLAIHVLDRQLDNPAFVDQLFAYVDQDRRDRTTEYGGIIMDSARLGGIRPILFVPRTAAREGDYAFPEPADMTRQGDRAMGVFHFHAAELEMLEHTGPSLGDLRYAAASGRNCLVFTSLRERRLAVDYYQGNGVTIDLGEIPR
ncbi:MAG: hypothetical protein R3B68_11840 [Phycisphaerales bacterium]